MASERSEFIVLYGRRRVGKTFLVKSFFNEQYAFCYTGVQGITKRQQLDNFAQALKIYSHGSSKVLLKDWFEAFSQLETLLSSSVKPGKKVVFIDEMPWMDS